MAGRRNARRQPAEEGERVQVDGDGAVDLLGVSFWTAMQEEHRAGRIPDLYPYPPERRF